MSEIVLSEGDVHGIVTILIEDAELAQSKQRFYNSIGLPHGEFVDVERRAFFSGASESYVFFNLSLAKWIQLKGSDATLSILVSILKQENFIQTAAKLTSWTPEVTSSSSAQPILSTGVFGKDLPTNGWLTAPRGMLSNYDSTKIYPRTQDGQPLTEIISDALEKNGSVVMNGPDGFGKTSTTFSYANMNFRKYSYMIWLECTNLTRLEIGVKALAQKLGIPLEIRLYAHSEQSTVKHLGQLFDEIYSKLGRKKCLFIFDNVQIPEQIQLYLPGPQYTNDFHLLFTAAKPITYLTNLEMSAFAPEEAVHYLCKRLGLRSDQLQEQELVKTLAQKFCYVPVALQLLIIDVPDVTIHLKEYLNKYDVLIVRGKTQQKLETALNVAIDSTRNDQEKRFGAETAEVTIDLLHLTAFFDPEDDLPIDLFNNVMKPELVQHCLQALVNRNIVVKLGVTGNPNKETFRIHSVWHEILLNRLKKSKDNTKNRILELGMKTGNAANKHSSSIDQTLTDLLRENLWDFCAVKTNALFGFNPVARKCWRTKYFDSEFCQKQIGENDDLAFARITKILLFMFILNIKFWILHFTLPLIIGVALAYVDLNPYEFSSSVRKDIILFSVGCAVGGSILCFCIGLILCTLTRMKLSHSYRMGLQIIWLNLFVGAVAVWPLIIFDLISWTELLKLFQMGAGICVSGIYALCLHLKGWSLWLISILLAVGISNTLHGFAMTIWKDEWLTIDDDLEKLFNIINFALCLSTILIVSIANSSAGNGGHNFKYTTKPKIKTQHV